MKMQKKRGWILSSAAAVVLIGTLAQFTTSCAQSGANNSSTTTSVVATTIVDPAGQPAPTANAAASTNVAPADLPKLPADLSPGLAEVIKLAQSNVGDDVITAYIKNSGNVYKPTADEILYLNDLGVSQDVINTLMQNGRAGSAPAVASAPVGAQQQIPTPPSSATLSSPEVPTYNLTQDAPLGGPTPPPDVPLEAPSTTVVEQAPPPEVTVNYFYDTLAPYGSWVYVEGYGRCWRPTVAVVNAGWRPYCDNGYWVNTDCGWYWRSYYSWGWAPFHYGRWCTAGNFGWVWVPDCTWGPAWVAWRQHDRYCGWAPLPPYAAWRPGVGIVWTGGGHHGHVDWGFGLSVGAFTFVAYDRFTDHHAWRYQAPRHETVNIYNHSTVINNTVIVNNRTIINNGVPRERIQQATHKTVQTYALKDTSTIAAHGSIERVGTKPALAVYRPSATVIAKTAPKAPSKAPVLVNTGLGHALPSTVVKTQTRVERTTTPTHNPAISQRAGSTTVTQKSVETKTTTVNANGKPEVHTAWPGENVGRTAKPPQPASRGESSRSSVSPRAESSRPAITPRAESSRSVVTPRAESARPTVSPRAEVSRPVTTPAPVTRPATPPAVGRPSASYEPNVRSAAPRAVERSSAPAVSSPRATPSYGHSASAPSYGNSGSGRSAGGAPYGIGIDRGNNGKNR